MSRAEAYAVLARTVAHARNGCELEQSKRLYEAMVVAREAMLGVRVHPPTNRPAHVVNALMDYLEFGPEPDGKPK